MNPGEKIIAGRRVRWDEERAEEAYARGVWVRETLADACRKAARETPDRVLILDGSVSLDCQSLCDQATLLAQAMLARAPCGSVVSFMLPNWHEAAVIYVAVTMAGMVANPILPSLRDRELSFILQAADARLIFAPAIFRQYDYAAMLSRVVGQLAAPPDVFILRGDAGAHAAYTSLLQDTDGRNGEIDLPELNADAVRMIMFTSGTTGRPKGVLHTHNSIHALIHQLGEHWLIEAGDRFLVASPISHIGGSIYAFECPLLLGTAAILMDRWNADEAVRVMDDSRCTHMAGATPFLEQILGGAERAGTRFLSLKAFICGGASVPPALIRRAACNFERAVVTRVYGSTEVPVTTVGAMIYGDLAHAADTDGRPGLADVRLVDDAGNVAVEGEIRVLGPQMLVGYLDAEDENGAFDTDGYYRSGDLGRWMDGDYLVVTGRTKDIIIRNGENISPKEIEDILIGHPAIAEVAVVGLADGRTGERVCAVIVPLRRPGPDVADLHNFLSGHGLAKFKIPEQVVMRDSLPRNDAGKVLKAQIRMEIDG
jgi:acyl-CoA synthetase (AMP-forming)/AMP-acid ligase II